MTSLSLADSLHFTAQLVVAGTAVPASTAQPVLKKCASVDCWQGTGGLFR